jgi:hypothetical protein
LKTTSVSRAKVGLVQACDDRQLFGFKLWPKQRDLLAALDAGPRLQVWALGRRSGKTTLGAIAALGNALLRPDLDAMIRPGERRHAVAVATNLRQARLLSSNPSGTSTAAPPAVVGAHSTYAARRFDPALLVEGEGGVAGLAVWRRGRARCS